MEIEVEEGEIVRQVPWWAAEVLGPLTSARLLHDTPITSVFDIGEHIVRCMLMTKRAAARWECEINSFRTLLLSTSQEEKLAFIHESVNLPLGVSVLRVPVKSKGGLSEMLSEAGALDSRFEVSAQGPLHCEVQHPLDVFHRARAAFLGVLDDAEPLFGAAGEGVRVFASLHARISGETLSTYGVEDPKCLKTEFWLAHWGSVHLWCADLLVVLHAVMSEGLLPLDLSPNNLLAGVSSAGRAYEYVLLQKALQKGWSVTPDVGLIDIEAMTPRLSEFPVTTLTFRPLKQMQSTSGIPSAEHVLESTALMFFFIAAAARAMDTGDRSVIAVGMQLRARDTMAEHSLANGGWFPTLWDCIDAAYDTNDVCLLMREIRQCIKTILDSVPRRISSEPVDLLSFTKRAADLVRLQRLCDFCEVPSRADLQAYDRAGTTHAQRTCILQQLCKCITPPIMAVTNMLFMRTLITGDMDCLDVMSFFWCETRSFLQVCRMVAATWLRTHKPLAQQPWVAQYLGAEIARFVEHPTSSDAALHAALQTKMDTDSLEPIRRIRADHWKMVRLTNNI